MNTMTKAIERGGCLFDLYFLVTVHHEGKSNQEVKQKPQRRFVSWLAQPAFLYKPRTTAQWGHCPHGLGPPIRIITQENVPQECPRANRMEAIPQLSLPLPR